MTKWESPASEDNDLRDNKESENHRHDRHQEQRRWGERIVNSDMATETGREFNDHQVRIFFVPEGSFYFLFLIDINNIFPKMRKCHFMKFLIYR